MRDPGEAVAGVAPRFPNKNLAVTFHQLGGCEAHWRSPRILGGSQPLGLSSLSDDLTVRAKHLRILADLAGWLHLDAVQYYTVIVLYCVEGELGLSFPLEAVREPGSDGLAKKRVHAV